MKLTTAQLEQVRLSILRYCLRPTRTGMIYASLIGEGFPLKRDQVEDEIVYLSDPKKGLLEHLEKLISPENKIWRTTAAGRDYLVHTSQEES